MDRFAILQGYYWWLAEHHSGQGDARYARLCGTPYKPSMRENGPNTGSSLEVYHGLCEKNCKVGYVQCECCSEVIVRSHHRGYCDECQEANCVERSDRDDCDADEVDDHIGETAEDPGYFD